MKRGKVVKFPGHKRTQERRLATLLRRMVVKSFQQVVRFLDAEHLERLNEYMLDLVLDQQSKRKK
jgi:hypothetical protein